MDFEPINPDPDLLNPPANPTLEEFKDNWKSYGVRITEDGVDHVIRLKDRFMICWGIQEDAILLDEGGEQGATAVLLRVIDGVLHSVLPGDPVTQPVGPLVLI